MLLLVLLVSVDMIVDAIGLDEEEDKSVSIGWDWEDCWSWLCGEAIA